MARASELAKRIYQLEWNQIDVIDQELQDVREALGWAFGENSGYWSYLMHENGCPWTSEPENFCSCRVQRARNALSSLQVEE